MSPKLSLQWNFLTVNKSSLHFRSLLCRLQLHTCFPKMRKPVKSSENIGIWVLYLNSENIGIYALYKNPTNMKSWPLQYTQNRNTTIWQQRTLVRISLNDFLFHLPFILLFYSSVTSILLSDVNQRGHSSHSRTKSVPHDLQNPVVTV